MSENRALVKLAVLRLAWKELEHLNDDQKAALGVVCHAANEVNALMRINLFQRHETSGPDEIDIAYWSQRAVVLRTWSAKLFEFLEFVEELCSEKKPSTRDAEIRQISALELANFPSAREHPGYEFARESRNELSFHYKLKPAKVNAKHIAPNADVSFLLHRMRGNNFFRLGEELTFTGLLLRKTANAETDEDRLKLFDDWMDWNMAATNWLDSSVLSFVQALILDRFPDRSFRERVYWIDPKLIADADEVLVPLFLRDTVV